MVNRASPCCVLAVHPPKRLLQWRRRIRRPSAFQQTSLYPLLAARLCLSPPLCSSAHVSARLQAGSAPLHWAAQGGQTAVASLLLVRGADVGAKTNVSSGAQGRTPFPLPLVMHLPAVCICGSALGCGSSEGAEGAVSRVANRRTSNARLSGGV